MSTYALLRDAAERSIRYLDGLADRGVAASRDIHEVTAALGTELPDEPQDPAAVLALLDQAGSPATAAMAGPRFYGFVIGGALPAAVAANWLATAWDQNTAFSDLTPATVAVEDIALAWLVDVLGLPPGTGGAFVTGATMASFSALAAARRSVLRKVGWDVEADGLFGAPEVTVVVGEETHPSVSKGLGLLGFGRSRVVTVPADGQGRMRPDAMPSVEPPAIVCIQAGNVNSGAMDPAKELCARAREMGAWVHVDGAFGLWAAATPSHAHLAEGIADADSWATDAHKLLNVPYDSGIAFVREPEHLRAAMAVSAAYLPSSKGRQPAEYTPELSRRARGVEVWAALRSLGRSGLAELIGRVCRHARRFAEGLSGAGYEVLNDVVLNQVLVSFGDADATDRVIAGIQADGTCWCGGTVWQGRRAMRISVCSWRTTDEDVERSLDAMLRVAAREARQ